MALSPFLMPLSGFLIKWSVPYKLKNYFLNQTGLYLLSFIHSEKSNNPLYMSVLSIVENDDRNKITVVNN